MVTQFKSNATYYGILKGFDIFYDITYHVQDMTYSCYAALFEGYDQLLGYGDFVTNPSYLLTNLIYNFGLMYNSVKDVIVFFQGSQFSGAKTAHDAGYELGSLLYYIFMEESPYP